MNKQQEIEHLTKFVQGYPSDSYCGMWLRHQLPQIVTAIQTDLMPELRAITYIEFQEFLQLKVKSTEAAAQASAKNIRDSAEQTRLNCRNSCNELVTRLKNQAVELVKMYPL